MAFEMKYDVNGIPIRQPEPKFEEQPAPLEAVVENQPTHEEPLVENQTEEATPEVETNPELSTKQPQNNPEKPARESHQAMNFRAMKEKALVAERRAQELEAAMMAMQSQKQPAVQEEPEEEVSIDADALVEGKHLSKVTKHIKKLEQQVKQYERQSVENATEARIKYQYPDFDKIVCKENLESLRMAYPEIAQSLNSNPDLYAKAVSAYTMIKKLGIGEDEDKYVEEKASIQKNAAKPKPLASINPQQGDSPLSKANAFANGKLTDELKAQMIKEMNQYRSR